MHQKIEIGIGSKIGKTEILGNKNAIQKTTDSKKTILPA